MPRITFFTSAAAAAAALTLAMHAHAGAVKGTVVWEGNAPPMRPIDMGADAACAAMHGDDAPTNEALVLGANQEMANIIVQITEGLPDDAEYPVPEEPAVLTQEGCQYKPHVFVIRQGQTLHVKNPDGILHNVNGQDKDGEPFNRAMPANLEQFDIQFDLATEEPFQINCDIHPWMRAYGAVLDHPYHDVTDATGEFVIEDLEPGDYTLQAWHERLGAQTATISIPEEGDAEQDFTFDISMMRR